jgi:proline dehydrogenase
VSTAASAVLVPVVQRFAGDQISGNTIDDAMAVARRIATPGTASILGFWDTADYADREVVDIYLATIERLSANDLDSYVSLKAPALRFDLGAAREIAAAAQASNVRCHFDSHAPEAVDASHAMVRAMVGTFGAHRIGTTVPARWTRSAGDAEWAIEHGLNIRVVKGQWPDPSGSMRDTRPGFLDMIGRLAGRARHVAVATHDIPLAAKAIARLRAAGTPCELEQILGMTTARSAALTVANGIAVRIYIPFGRGYVPNALGTLRRNPRLAWTLAKQLLTSRRP